MEKKVLDVLGCACANWMILSKGWGWPLTLGCLAVSFIRYIDIGASLLGDPRKPLKTPENTKNTTENAPDTSETPKTVACLQAKAEKALETLRLRLQVEPSIAWGGTREI